MFSFIYTMNRNWFPFLMPFMTILGGLFVWVVRRWLGNRRWIYWLTFLVWLLPVLFHTVGGRSVSEHGADWRLFGSYIRALEEIEYYRANFMNVLLFFPGGMLLAFAMQGIKVLQKKWKLFWVTTLILCVMSLSIELLQYWFSLGMAETDDVLHNTLGAMLGCGAGMMIYRLVNRLQEESSA